MAGIAPFLKKHFFLLLILLSGAFICFYRLDRIPLDGDEAVTANIATGFGYIRIHPFDGFAKYEPVKGPVFSSADYWKRNSAQRTMRYTIDDCGHSFTSNLIIHYWLNIRGFSVEAMRQPAALFILISILLFHVWIRRRLKDERAANIATLLFMLHALVVQVAHFARMYGLAVLLLMCLLLLYDNLQAAIANKQFRKQMLSSALMGITAALLLVTHYITIVVIAALLADFIIVYRKEKRQTLIKIFTAALLPFCILLLIYLFPLNAIKSIRSVIEMNRIASDLSVPRKYFTPATPGIIVWGLLCRFTTSLGNSTSSETDLKSLLSILLIIFPLTIILLNIKQAAQRYGKRIIYFFLTGVITYTAISLLHIFATHTIVILHARYWIFVLPFSLGLLGICFIASLDNSRKTVRTISIICMAVLTARMAFTCLAYVGDLRLSAAKDKTGHTQLHQDRHWNGDWTIHASDSVKQQYRNGDTISYQSWVAAQQVNWHLKQYPQIIQRVDTAQREAILLLSPGGRLVLCSKAFASYSQ